MAPVTCLPGLRARTTGSTAELGAHMTDGSDLAWLGLERQGEGRCSFELTPPLSRMDGKLYGGTGISVAVATMEAETARDTLWTTVQCLPRSAPPAPNARAR
jgi:hypothetical protein